MTNLETKEHAMTDLNAVYIYVNEKRVSVAAFLAMEQATIKTVYASGCTALTELKADAAEYVYASGCTALTELKADAAEYVYASGCTALTELKADAAKTVDARGCTALTELKADAAKTVDARGCTALTELKADAAEYVYASGCTALTELKADAAKTVDASGCTALTELKADAAKTVDASGCTALTGYDLIEGGTDGRGYAFTAIKLHNEWRVIAGCRNFTIAQALAHWTASGRADCHAIINKLAAAIQEHDAKRGDGAATADERVRRG